MLRLRLVSGRRLTRRDGAGAPRVPVINETFARQVLAGEAAVGQRVRFTGMGSDDEPWAIVGVVEDVNYRGLALTGSVAEAFASVQQIDYVPTFAYNSPFVAMRTTGDPGAAIPFLREAVAGTRAGVSVASVMTVDARLSAAVAQPRFYAAFVGSFAALAVFLAALGVYGQLSYTVAQRRGEIAIRMALGARRGAVLALVMRQGAALVTVGAFVGLAAAAAGSRILQAFLFGVAADEHADVRCGTARAARCGVPRLLRAGATSDAHRAGRSPSLRVGGRRTGRGVAGLAVSALALPRVALRLMPTS